MQAFEAQCEYMSQARPVVMLLVVSQSGDPI